MKQTGLFEQPKVKQAARDTVNNRKKSAGTNGQPKQCQFCGEFTRTPHEHHWDYTQESETIALCPKCHKVADMLKQGRDPEDIVAWWEGR